MRFLKAAIISLFVSFGLVYMMSALVNFENDLLGGYTETTPIEFARVIKDSEADQRKRVLPQKPPKPKNPPKQPKQEKMTKNKPSDDSLSIPQPDLNSNLSGAIPFLGKGTGSGEIMPIVRILPQMPRKAAMKGIEGYVVVNFIVTKSGTTDNIRIVEARPSNIFNRAAKRAILKWKYKPQLVDGKPVEIEQSVRLNFELEDVE